MQRLYPILSPNSDQKDKNVYSRTLNRVISNTFDLDIVSLDEPPTEDDSFHLVQEKLFTLIKSLPDKKENIFNSQQQKMLLEHVTSLVKSPPVTLFALLNKDEKEKVFSEHKRTLIDVYDVISEPKKNFNHFQEKIKETKKSSRSNECKGILAGILGIVMIAIAFVFAKPTAGMSAFVGLGGDCLLTYSLFKFIKAKNGRELGKFENTVQNGLNLKKG